MTGHNGTLAFRPTAVCKSQKSLENVSYGGEKPEAGDRALPLSTFPGAGHLAVSGKLEGACSQHLRAGFTKAARPLQLIR